MTPSPASAWETLTWHGKSCEWDRDYHDLYLVETSFPTGSVIRAAVENSMTVFNDNPSDFRLYPRANTGGVSFDNDQSEVWLTDDTAWLDGADGRTKWYCTGYWLFGWRSVNMARTDVVLDATISWTASHHPDDLIEYEGGDTPIRTLLLHELGHVAGLAHEADEYNAMGICCGHVHAQGTGITDYVGEDAANGLIHLYGSNSYPDLAVSHWRYAGEYVIDGEDPYSDHRKVGAWKSDGTALARTTIGSQTYLVVNAGAAIQLEFTYENVGRSKESNFRVRFYLSPDRTIETTDREIGNFLQDEMGRGDVYTVTKTVTLPSDLASGTEFWIGAIIDPENAVGESSLRRSNNATWSPIPFRVP